MGRRRVYSTPRPGANRPGIRHARARRYSRRCCERRTTTQIHGIAISAHHGNQVPPPITAATAQMAMRADVTTAHAPMATVPGANLTGSPRTAPVGRKQRLPEVRRSPSQRGVRQLVQVDGGQVRQQLVELAQRLGVQGLLHALVEFLGGQPARGVVLAQQRRHAVAIRVRGADSRVTRHRAPS